MIKRIWFPVFLFVLSMTIDIYTGAEFDNCKEFIQVKVSDYDTDPKSVNDLSKRPLGFMSALIPFKAINSSAKNPCFQISLDNSTKQTVQVLATPTIGTSNVCVLSDLPGAQQTCDSALKTCPQNAIGHDTIKYVLSCETCDGNVTIWFRLTVSPSFTDGLDFENWCENFNANYPNSLIVLTRSPSDPIPSKNPPATTVVAQTAIGRQTGGMTTAQSMPSVTSMMPTNPSSDTATCNGKESFFVPCVFTLFLQAILSIVFHLV